MSRRAAPSRRIRQLRAAPVGFYARSAPHYDADYTAKKYTADIAFYRNLAVACGGPVLEMGCGTGRILLPTARAGVPIHGLDASPDMLRQLRRKLRKEPAAVRNRVRLTRGDMRSARLGRRFALVTAPFRSVQHLLERDDQRAWLRNVARHLRPGGSLCFDVFQPNYRLIAVRAGPTVELSRRDPTTGHRVRRICRTIPRPENQTVEVRFRWVTHDASGVRVSESAGQVVMRWFTRAELENLLELENFRIADYWGSFDRKPFGPGSRDQIIRATLRSHAAV